MDFNRKTIRMESMVAKILFRFEQNFRNSLKLIVSQLKFNFHILFMDFILCIAYDMSIRNFFFGTFTDISCSSTY